MYDVFDDFDGDFGDFDGGDFDEDGFGGADYDSDYEDRFFEENFNYEGEDDSNSFDNEEHFTREDQRQEEEPWISPGEASILGYGFAREECEAERRRRREIRRQERDRRKRRDDDSEIF